MGQDSSINLFSKSCVFLKHKCILHFSLEGILQKAWKICGMRRNILNPSGQLWSLHLRNHVFQINLECR